MDAITLNNVDAKELRIVKQAILKSAIEGGVIKKENLGTSHVETDEEFLERWIEWVYRNAEKDKRLTENDVPF